MAKPLKNKRTQESAPPTNRGPKLNTLAEVLAEMATIYRGARSRNIDIEVATKLTYMLTQLRQGIEGKLLEEVQSKIAELSAKVGASRG
jgi:hypothetical protein